MTRVAHDPEYAAVFHIPADESRWQGIRRPLTIALMMLAPLAIGVTIGVGLNHNTHEKPKLVTIDIDSTATKYETCPLSDVPQATFPSPPTEPFSGKDACLKCPSCLDPSGTCLGEEHMVFRVHPECFTKGFPHKIPPKDAALCKRSVYRCPTSGVIVTLPLLTGPELNVLYGCYYTNQAKIGINHERWISETSEISKFGGLEGKIGLTILEVGCAHAYVLYHLRHFAANGGKLIGVEPDPTYKPLAGATFAAAKKDTIGLETQLITELFNEDVVPPGSVDLVTSSQVLEHIPNTCAYIAAVKKVLKPGGLVFTDIPMQYYNFNASSELAVDFMLGQNGAKYMGEFHITLFGHEGVKDKWGGMPIGSPLSQAFLQSGFEKVWVAPPGQPNRYAFRKPLSQGGVASV